MTQASSALASNPPPVAAPLADDLTSGIAIPSCPAILNELRTEIGRNDPDVGAIARLVVADVALGVAVLRVVNSPIYGLSRKVESIAQAVSILGLKRLAVLVTNVLVRQALSCNGLDLDEFWERSNKRAFAMCSLAKIHRGIDADTAQSAGLLCDIGIPLLMQRFDDYGDTLKLANDFNVGIPLLLKQFPQYAAVIASGNEARPKGFTDIEFERHGLDHTKIGAMMARSWGLSDTLCQAIRHHHNHALLQDPTAADALRRLVAVCFIAEFTIQRLCGVVETHEWDQGADPALSALLWNEQDMNDWAEDLEAGLNGEF
jgi:HD-like signal output (HDOD) protein